MLKISSGLFGQFVDFLYLYAMKKDEIIELLKKQIKGLRDDNNRLLDQIDALIKEVLPLKRHSFKKANLLANNSALLRGSPNLYPTHPNSNKLPNLPCPKKSGRR